ncbi:MULTISPECIES: cellulose biosynthesis cyclic di-GMP-binding regulatory protein BcsB [unclassified Variovorax]|uniref:cellulose biosynthesis cyclic di-GMP-binding regulatory protein BcsB n=1 Tax=unclassified Variovorax TaxID=663243 RepID=UPI002577F445|nr:MULTISPECIES: cellulose biosynthesis cyclic di-GMP-binding regulatory protein BcsB [unclassified Variovorax]MDM0090265.1 cellulose biosynthesis cyclic di-GMP-binding regulatory protein BcsB [Variovorax sp. J22G40]MDM0148069.1 cellulose biosynthesis cyclic di-GMP-binding regulatory protein BcsB [Variovorax sp. J2P1-31]
MLALLAWAGGAADPALAQPRPLPTAAPAEGAPREFNLTQLGLNYAVQLRGVSGTVGIPFSVRADELVTSAALRLNYAYSPALIPELSHLKVSVNDVLVATLALPREGAGKAQTADIQIDRRLVTDFNRINVELVGHYTRECEDPQHSSLWAKIDASSTLRLSVTPLKTASDLAVLPQPFFDRRDVRRANIPFVFGGTPSSATLEVAGIVSSWFGALAGYRGATFPVTSDALPAGNAVVFATPETAIAGLTLPAITGPTVTVVDHPQDATRKLLLVLGRNAGELRSAATALTLNARAFSGSSATIASLQETPARKPYDAPRWIASDRPVQLGELAQPADLNVSGYTPDVVKVNLQMPPDLFTWRSRGIPLDLQYRYTPRVRNDQSTLNLSVDDNFIGSLPLRTANPGGERWWNPLAIKVMADGTASQRREVLLPPLALGSRSQLRMHYYFQPAAGNCQTLLDNVRGAIDPSSTLDISAFPHYMAMPELAAYANSGFPFSRLADLAETAVVLPDQPGTVDTETYLALLGQIGNATGYPALRVAVGRAANVSQWADKDLLVIGDLKNQPLFTQWADRMPLQRKAEARTFQLGQWIDDNLHLITGTRQREDLPSTTQMTVAEDGSDAVLAGFESPLRAGRSVVAVVSNAASQPSLLNALMTPDLLQRVQGSTAIVRGAEVHSVLTGDSYYVGKLPPLAWLQWNLSRSPLGLAGAAILLALLGAAAAYASLKGVARRRLRT